MAGVTIDISKFNAELAKLKSITSDLVEAVDAELQVATTEISALAKRRAPKENGQLAQFIEPRTIGLLQHEVTAGMPYSAYVEFGTGKYAAQYVGSLPADWSAYAAQFRGKGGPGTFKDMVRNLAEWIRRKGISGTYSVKTRRRTGNATNNRIEDYALAYLIARSILRNGIRPQPFLYPSVIEYMPTLEANLLNVVKELGK